jgi:hypothetical protein
MTKKKAATTNPASPTLIVFGTIDGKHRAGTFSEAEAALAKKAAAELGLSVLDVDNKSKRDLAAKLPAGRVHANASGFAPIARKAIYEVLTSIIGGDAQSNQEGKRTQIGTDEVSSSSPQKPSKPRLPKTWDDIQPGDLVLSQDRDPADGFWEAIVVRKAGTMYTLKWRQRQLSQRAFFKHHYNLGLMWPGEDMTTKKSEPNDAGSIYPRSWKAIGLQSLVLAQEQGPMQQWWEATPIKIEGDTFTLKWRDFPTLPNFVRPRFALALLHPNPTGVKASSKTAA